MIIQDRAMDPLSQILSLIEARSHLTAALQTGGAWAVRFAAREGVKFNALVRGSCWLAVDGAETALQLEAGDCFLLTAGRSFVLASDLAIAPVEAEFVFADATNGMARLGDSAEVLAVGGQVELEPAQASLLLNALPPLIHVRGDSDQAAALGWMLDRLAHELAAHEPGAALMCDHLVHMMFVQALRAHLAEGGQASSWLGALGDKRISVALGLIHGDPAHRWTLPELARAASMSRSNFALRFRSLVGVPPLDYLLRWRMRLAAQILRQSADPIGIVAASVGYESESTFSSTFKRVVGISPLRFRHASMGRRAARPPQVAA